MNTFSFLNYFAVFLPTTDIVSTYLTTTLPLDITPLIGFSTRRKYHPTKVRSFSKRQRYHYIFTNCCSFFLCNSYNLIILKVLFPSYNSNSTSPFNIYCIICPNNTIIIFSCYNRINYSHFCIALIYNKI